MGPADRRIVAASPESANNAGAQTSLIPLLTQGLPPNAVMVTIFGITGYGFRKLKCEPASLRVLVLLPSVKAKREEAFVED